MGVASTATSTRVEVRDADDGRLVATGSVTHAGARPDATEQLVETWWDGLVDAVAAADLRTDVAALAVAGQRQALVFVDGAGAAIHPASLRTDTRATTTATELVARLGADRLARATGHVTGSDTPLARLVWRLGADPTVADRAAAVLGAADVLTARLTGRQVTDRGGASGTGWWDPVAGRWRTDLLDHAARPAPPAGWHDLQPEVLRPSEPADRVSANVPELVRLRGRPIVAAGTGDLMARALAAAVRPGSAAALLDDDDGAVVAVTTTPSADPSGRVLGFCDAAGNHLPTVDIAPLGEALGAVARLLGTDAAGLAARAAKAGDQPGPVLVPARRPGRGATLLGGLVGLDRDTTPEAVARGALLGAAVEILDALAALDDVGGGEPEEGQLVLAGPVARWPGLAPAVAALAGREVVVAGGGGAATGACVQAAAALHDRGPLQVVSAWALGAGEAVEPPDDMALDELLARHATARALLAGRRGQG